MVKVYDFEINRRRVSIMTAGTSSKALRKAVYKYLKKFYNGEVRVNRNVSLRVKFIGVHNE
jgi:hypothetical protein